MSGNFMVWSSTPEHDGSALFYIIPLTRVAVVKAMRRSLATMDAMSPFQCKDVVSDGVGSVLFSHERSGA